MNYDTISNFESEINTKCNGYTVEERIESSAEGVRVKVKARFNLR